MIHQEITEKRNLNIGKFDKNVEFTDERDYSRRATDRGDEAGEIINGFLVDRREKERRSTDRA